MSSACKPKYQSQ